MLWAMIKSSIFKNKIQKILVFLTCFLATLLLCAMLNITLGIGNEVGKQLRSYGSNIIVLPKGSNLSIEVGGKIYEPLKNKSYLEENDLHKIKEIFWRNNITAFAPFLDGSVMMKDKEVLIIGTYFDKHIEIADEDDFSTGIKNLYPILQVDGEWIKDDDSSNIMLGDEFASKNSLKIGDTVNLNGLEFQVVGILHNAGKNANKIIMSLNLAQQMLNKQGVFSHAEVSALTIPEDDLSQKARRDTSSLNQLEFDKWYCSAYVNSIAYQIEEDFKGASAKPQTAISDAESLIISKIQSLMGLTALICLVVSSIAIASLMSSEIHSRKKEIGLLKVLGANAFQIYVIFASENVLVALIAALFGFAFGVGLSELIALSIFDYTIAISFIALPLCLAFALIIVLLGCLLSLKDIVNLLPVQVLYGK
ncbi:ABC transporter permease [Campylobacter troglodytis]|uniref:ABC transporter permease n=1 Tax=Campylobacter troglodytis TaxID=654363 RepID=UPI00115B4C3E|nr:ABC transporter permease [Campylobacter troglodytis]TQR60966.1 ABC transporter permease [Campylobacter troglodytis]